MALSRNMSIDQIRNFLQNELSTQLENDVKPILSVKGESGFFGIPKQLMTFIDFMGAVYRGVTLEKGRNGKKVKVLARTWKAKLYIKEVLQETDIEYQQSGDIMYEMYRHGLIHLYQPKDLKRGKRIVSWLSYKGTRTSNIIVKTDKGDFPLTVTHLKITPHPSVEDRDLLPISINCLYEDVYKSVEMLLKKIEKYKKYQNRWKKSVNYLLKPKII